ncbi:Acetoacetate decarboxylase [Desulfatibacillum aliphaticivorans]|uniref:Acetoacetate decarboxylase n=1 Tax=Desulfatibacillum aliphaticivorans TaxID=218208 RepID=B8F8T0_DESAL|nr:acetoacetate decarboxylase family protein [Desulfatibacillum aliphaticivorans]ACL01962.1 Acetoacetate decarboxylase [Desulfatibacillum aliphaticivorans]
MFKFDPYQQYMMPAHFGPRNRKAPSGWYHNVTSMVVSYRTDREKLSAYLPEPFEVAEDPIITIVYSCNKEVDWLAGHGYNLIGVNASVVFNGAVDRLEGFYTLVMWENLADPILTGREVQGIPKIYADIPDHSVIGGVFRAKASHFSSPIMEMSITDLYYPSLAELKERQDFMEGRDNWMGWKYIANPDGFGSMVSEPTLFPAETKYKALQMGTGSINWESLTWEQNPTQYHIVNALAELPIVEYLPAIVTQGSTNLAVEGVPVRALK